MVLTAFARLRASPAGHASCNARSVPEILIPLTPTTQARMELVMVEPDALFRLTVDHPATHLVEYFLSSDRALARWAELQDGLSGPPQGDFTPAASTGHFSGRPSHAARRPLAG